MNFPDMWRKIKEKDEDTMSNIPFGMSIEIDEEVFQKIMHWVNKSDHEVSGLGSVEVDTERNVFRVVDAILLEQENTMSTTDLNDEDVGKAMFEHHRDKKPGMLKWWWHSHVDMEVFWSGTDMSTIKKLGSGGWFIATVFNKKEGMKSAFVQSSPIRLITEDVATSIDKQTDPWAEYRKEWSKEYEDKVNEKSYSLPTSTVNGFPNLGYGFSSSVVVPKKNHVGFHPTIAEEMDEEEVDEDEQEELNEKWKEDRSALLEELFNMHTNGNLTDQELYNEIRELDDLTETTSDEEEGEEEEEYWEEIAEGVWKTEDGTIVDDAGTPLLTDEEAALFLDKE